MKTNRTTLTMVVLLVAAAITGCSGELTDSAAPVELVATNTQNLQIVDIGPNTDPDCDQSVTTVILRLVPKREDVTTDVTQVRVTRYRVSYTRTDGGRQVPASFVRAMDELVAVGADSELSDFLIVEPDALTQSPFVALQPQNGGRDPDTGRPFVKMTVTMEFYGETLGGDRVYDSTQFPLDFCYGCGGCD
jgi:hypothetical protein